MIRCLFRGGAAGRKFQGDGKEVLDLVLGFSSLLTSNRTPARIPPSVFPIDEILAAGGSPVLRDPAVL